MSKLKALPLLALMAISIPSCSDDGSFTAYEWDYDAYAIYIDGSLAYDQSAINLAYKEDMSMNMPVLWVRYDVQTTEYVPTSYTITCKHVGHPYRIVRKTS